MAAPASKPSPPAALDSPVKCLGQLVVDDGPRLLEPPDAIRGLGPEERAALEARLVRKVDLRLLPMVVVMYILNYIDR